MQPAQWDGDIRVDMSDLERQVRDAINHIAPSVLPAMEEKRDAIFRDAGALWPEVSGDSRKALYRETLIRMDGPAAQLDVNIGHTDNSIRFAKWPDFERIREGWRYFGGQQAVKRAGNFKAVIELGRHKQGDRDRFYNFPDERRRLQAWSENFKPEQAELAAGPGPWWALVYRPMTAAREELVKVIGPRLLQSMRTAFESGAR